MQGNVRSISFNFCDRLTYLGARGNAALHSDDARTPTPARAR